MNYLATKAAGICTLLALAGSGCFANDLQRRSGNVFDPAAWTAVAADRLAAMRGGFDLGSGLQVSFGIVRNVMINGQLVSSTRFNFADLGKVTPEEARLAMAAVKNTVIKQLGDGNYAGTGIRSLATGGIVIQNTLDNQNIQFSTVINTGVNNLQLLKATNTHSVLKDALMGAMGAR
jgi:hypothetical protein